MTTPNLTRVLQAHLDERLAGVNTSMPGEVTSYNAATGRATVQPLIPRGYLDEQGERQSELLPAITDVPVMRPGSGGDRLKYDIRPGDAVLLLFASASLDRWLATGRSLDPQDDRRHTLSDAIAISGLGIDGALAPTYIEFTDTRIRANGGDERLAHRDAVIDLRNEVADALDAISGGAGSAVRNLSISGTTILRGD